MNTETTLKKQSPQDSETAKTLSVSLGSVATKLAAENRITFGALLRGMREAGGFTQKGLIAAAIGDEGVTRLSGLVVTALSHCSGIKVHVLRFHQRRGPGLPCGQELFSLVARSVCLTRSGITASLVRQEEEICSYILEDSLV